MLDTGNDLNPTTKMREMARAFSPANNNQQNMQKDLTISPDRSPLVKAEESADVQQRQSGQGKASQQQRNVQSASGMPEVQSMLGNLGIFNLQLNAGMNSFLNSAPTSSTNAKLTAGGTPVFNQKTGQWELPQQAQVQAETSSLVEEKLGQQRSLQQLAGEIFNETGSPKSFEQVLKKFGDKNGDGVIDAQEQLWLNQAFEIVNNLRRLKNEDPYSAEAAAIRAQLTSKDRNGIVSGLLQALDDYDEIVNKKATGSEAEAYYLKDILTMDKDKIESEIQKALTASSGLFGADYETYLQRELDNSAQEYQGAAEEDATVMQSVKEISDAWLRAYDKEFKTTKDQLNSMFQGASNDLVKNLESLSQSGNKGVKQAMEWFVDTQTMVNTGGKDFSSIVFQALVDSPLGADSKRTIKKWLGETIGADVAERGILSALLEKISSTGYFWTEDVNGNRAQVSLNGEQKMDIVRLINDQNMTDQQKTDEIQKYIDSLSKGMGGRLTQDLQRVVGPIRSGNLSVALNNWRGSMAQSLEGFDGSLVQEGYSSVVKNMGRQNSPQAMQAAIEQHAQRKIDEISSALKDSDRAIIELGARVSRDVATMNNNIAQTSSLKQTGVQSVIQNYRNGFETYKKDATTPSANYTINGKPVTIVEAMWQQSRPTSVAMPSNIVSFWGPLQAARSMVQNLKGNSDPEVRSAYSVLLRDYFGGNEGNVSKMINGDLFNPEVTNLAVIAARIFTDSSFGASVFETTNVSKAITQRVQENQNIIEQARAKLAETQAARGQLNDSYNRVARELATSTRGATMGVAQVYNAAVDGNLAPLRANIGDETADRLFNSALNGQSMPFTSMPKIDIDALRRTGMISYVERGSGLSPAGYGQYVQKEFVPAGSKIATSRPTFTSGKPSAPAATAPAAKPVQTTTATEKTSKDRGEPIDAVRKQGYVITPTDNPNTVLVRDPTTGKQTLANVAQTPKGPVLMDPQGGLNPVYPPAGAVDPASRLPTDPNIQKQPERGDSSIFGDIAGWLKERLNPIPETKASRNEAIAKEVNKQQTESAIARAKEDFVFDKQPAQGENADYYRAYNDLKEKSDAATAAKSRKPATSSSSNEGKENSERERSSSKNKVKETGDTRDGDKVFRAGNQKMV